MQKEHHNLQVQQLQNHRTKQELLALTNKSSLQKSVLDIMSKLYQLALTKNERSYRDLWRNRPPRFLQCRYEIAMPSRLTQNLVMSSPINRRGIQSSDTSSDLFCEVRMNSPKFTLQICMELNLFYQQEIIRNKKENFGIPPRNREEQKILLNFRKRTNKRLV